MDYLNCVIQTPERLLQFAYEGRLSFTLLDGWEKNKSKNAGKYLFSRALDAVEATAVSKGYSDALFYIFLLSWIGSALSVMLTVTWLSWLWPVDVALFCSGIVAIISSGHVYRLSCKQLEHGVLAKEDFIWLHDRLVFFFSLHEQEGFPDLWHGDFEAIVRKRLTMIAQLIRQMEEENVNIPLEHWESKKKPLVEDFEEGFELAAQFALVDREAGYRPFYELAKKAVDAST